MKLLLPAAMLLAATAAPALAQDAPAAPANANTVPPADAAETPRFTLETPVEELVANEAAKAVLDANMPGLTTHESYDMFKGMSLKQLQPYSGGAITDESMTKVETELAGIE